MAQYVRQHVPDTLLVKRHAPNWACVRNLASASARPGRSKRSPSRSHWSATITRTACISSAQGGSCARGSASSARSSSVASPHTDGSTNLPRATKWVARVRRAPARMRRRAAEDRADSHGAVFRTECAGEHLVGLHPAADARQHLDQANPQSGVTLLQFIGGIQASQTATGDQYIGIQMNSPSGRPGAACAIARGDRCRSHAVASREWISRERRSIV